MLVLNNQLLVVQVVLVVELVITELAELVLLIKDMLVGHQLQVMVLVELEEVVQVLLELQIQQVVITAETVEVEYSRYDHLLDL